MGRKQLEKTGHGEWNVPFESGTLVAVGYNGGEKVCEDKRVTTGVASKLVLKSEIPVKNNGKDIALITCSCVDENGNPVMDADEYVEFTTDENSVCIATGSDVTDTKSVCFNKRKMYMGKISVAVKPLNGNENITVYAHISNCGYATINIKTENEI